ncbi:MAG: hypothetical protein H0V90_11395, partial [Blastocatellia bacterium]|nr:hypothetical protein [Blastocatellia bacterium]
HSVLPAELTQRIRCHRTDGGPRGTLHDRVVKTSVVGWLHRLESGADSIDQRALIGGQLVGIAESNEPCVAEILHQVARETPGAVQS